MSGPFKNSMVNEIFPFAPTWMDLGGIMLGEISNTEKDKYCMISLTCGILKNQNHRNRDRICGCQRCEVRAGEQLGEGG